MLKKVRTICPLTASDVLKGQGSGNPDLQVKRLNDWP